MLNNQKGGTMTRKSKGFTIVEMIIALAIAGILASIIIPMINNYNRPEVSDVVSDVVR